jgi:hypothetical protein
VRDIARSAPRLLYEVYARPWLGDIALRLGRAATLADVPDSELDRLAGLGVDLVWLMGAWPSGPKGIAIARSIPELRAEYAHVLGSFTEEDVGGSPYSIAHYEVDPLLGGAPALAGFRERLARRGMRLMLDFVVNHTGVDHDWIVERPDLYIQGTEEDLARSPRDFFAVDTSAGRRVLAHGRDPNFPGWTDTAQLNLMNPETRAALARTLDFIAAHCDGVRCDLSMLALETVFHRTWGERARAGLPSPVRGELWPELIAAARGRHPTFLFLAEVYWGLDAALQQLGFDFTYDKILHERLRTGSARELRDHLGAALAHQQRSARFLENHDEQRAAAAFSCERHQAAAVVAATVPGLFMIHDGQLEGRRVKLPIQLRRRPPEERRPEVEAFYRRLLTAARERTEDWRLLGTRPAWEGNPSWDGFIVSLARAEGKVRLTAVNFAAAPGQCYVPLIGAGLGGRQVELRDPLTDARFMRDGSDLESRGLYLDLPAYGAHVFEVTALAERVSKGHRT